MAGEVKRYPDLIGAAAETDTDLLAIKQTVSNADAEPVKWTLAACWSWIVAKITANAAAVRAALGLATVATSGSASDLGSGTLPAGRLPNPSSSTLGGIQSKAAVSHQFLTSISTSGVPALAQPVVADVTGAAASGANSDITSLTGLTTPLSVAQGGTAGATQSAARTGLGLVIGTNVQAWDADLDAFAALVSAANKIAYYTGLNTMTLADFIPPAAFVPTFTLATPGDLSVAYSTQTGQWSQVGKRVDFIFSMTCTPTFTTATGNLRFVLTGLPNMISGQAFPVMLSNIATGITWTASRTEMHGRVLTSNNIVELVCFGSNLGMTFLTNTAIVSGVSLTINMAGWYFTT